MTEKKAEKVSEHLELDELYWFLGRKGTSETRENVYLITMISRNPRLIVGFDVAFDKSLNGFRILWTVYMKQNIIV